MYCYAKFENLKKDYKFTVLTQTPDDMAEFIDSIFCSYIACLDIYRSDDEYFEIESRLLY